MFPSNDFFNRAVPPRPALTVNLIRAGNDIIARGIAQDETLFEHVHFASLQESYTYLKDKFNTQYKVILNVHPSCRELP